jgi:hypothetical protein
MRKLFILLLIITVGFPVLLQQTISAQETQKKDKDYKNTIRFNITNPIIFGKSYIIGYERIINSRQSFSVNFGSNAFPSLGIINSDSFKVNTIRDDKGFNFSVDYRFYLAKENKYAAPHGVYIGPYYSYNYFDKQHSWSVKGSNGFNGTVDSDLSLGIHTIGIEMGYQFIFWKRLSVDMILAGPGIAAYNLKASLSSNLSDADKQKLYEKLNEALAEKFPGYSAVIKEGDFQKTGTAKTTSFGFRYIIQVGFRF